MRNKSESGKWKELENIEWKSKGREWTQHRKSKRDSRLKLYRDKLERGSEIKNCTKKLEVKIEWAGWEKRERETVAKVRENWIRK